MRTLAAVFTIAALAAPSIAHADPHRPKKVWYGGLPLIADTAAIGLAVGGGLAIHDDHKRLGEGLAIASVATYLLAAPIIEGQLGHTDHAGGSALVRLALPVVLGGVGLSQGGLGGGVAGGGLGAFAAVFTDDLILTYDTVPYVAPTPAGSTDATVGLAGTF